MKCRGESVVKWGVAGAVAAMSVAGASPAFAATLVDNLDGSFTATVTGPPNEVVYICVTAVPAASCNSTGYTYRSQTGGTFTTGSAVFAPILGNTTLPAGTYNVSVANDSGGSPTNTLTNVVIGSVTPPPDSSSGTTGGPASVIQQFGMPATGTCDEAQPEGLNWSGVPSGGWGISWSRWINEGAGGAVCTRTLNYSTVQSKWVVN